MLLCGRVIKVSWMSRKQPHRASVLLAICGVLGPILYTIVLVTVGFLHPGYNHARQLISELGAVGAPNAMIMNLAGFSLLGILTIAFSFGLYLNMKDGISSKIGLAFLVVSGVGQIAVGFFPCDPGCVNVSFTGIMHVVSARILWIGMVIAQFAIAQPFRNDPKWERYWGYTLATGLVTLIIGIMLGFVVIEGWTGALQRVFNGVRLLWIEIIAIRLLRLSSVMT